MYSNEQNIIALVDLYAKLFSLWHDGRSLIRNLQLLIPILFILLICLLILHFLLLRWIILLLKT